MTVEEVKQEMSCRTVKEGVDFGKEKVLVPVYESAGTIGTPLYAFGDGNKNGWEVGDTDKCFRYFDLINKKAIYKNRLAEKRNA